MAAALIIFFLIIFFYCSLFIVLFHNTNCFGFSFFFFFFFLLFIAFYIKMPIFPWHTWQPDAYEQSPTAVTMVLSGIMVKMGLFAVIRWLLPVFPLATIKYSHIIIILSVTGILYASLIAMQQD